MIKHGIGPYAPAGYKSDMPVFGDVLSDAEIWAVLAYIKNPLAARNPPPPSRDFA